MQNNDNKKLMPGSGPPQSDDNYFAPTPAEPRPQGFDFDPDQMKVLEASPFYHGNVGKDYVNELLPNNGDALLRHLQVGPDQGWKCHMTYRFQGFLSNAAMLSKLVNGQKLYYFNQEHCFPDPVVCFVTYVQKGLIIETTEKTFAKKCIPRPPWEVKKEDIKMGQKIGEGAFGEVMTGWMDNKPVAIKVMKVNAKTMGKVSLMKKEAAFMGAYKHRNIVKFCGAHFDGREAFIVMELVEGGGLDTYLRVHAAEVSTPLRLSWCYDAASAIAFLHRRGCLHRDIGARNCLVDLQAKTIKLSDFGMSSRNPEVKLAPDEQLAIRWVAPETWTQRVYVKESEVWSYGVLVWEIMSNGKQPYEEIRNLAEIKEKITSVEGEPWRLTMEGPHWTAELKEIVTACWEMKPGKRPPIELICHRLHRHSNHPVSIESTKAMDAARRMEEARKKKKKEEQGRTSKSRAQSKERNKKSP